MWLGAKKVKPHDIPDSISDSNDWQQLAATAYKVCVFDEQSQSS